MDWQTSGFITIGLIINIIVWTTYCIKRTIRDLQFLESEDHSSGC